MLFFIYFLFNFFYTFGINTFKSKNVFKSPILRTRRQLMKAVLHIQFTDFLVKVN